MKSEWFKSSKSGTNGGSCVEVREWQDQIQVRDSKDKEGPQLTFTPDAWRTFLLCVANGDFDVH